MWLVAVTTDRSGDSERCVGVSDRWAKSEMANFAQYSGSGMVGREINWVCLSAHSAACWIDRVDRMVVYCRELYAAGPAVPGYAASSVQHNAAAVVVCARKVCMPERLAESPVTYSVIGCEDIAA